ncbi:MAG: hypothetical protein MK100_09365 [Phycisphaerales bacterium]|nr:hypothetical protein [Phycisphaerales bacterium]
MTAFQHVVWALVATTHVAVGDVLFDQIGAADGSSMAYDTWGSMHFLPSPSYDLDIAAVDDFRLDAASTVTSIEFVLDGWYNFGGPEGVAGFHLNIYSNLDRAMHDLTGDLLSMRPEPILVEDWDGPGWLIRLEVDLKLNAGDYFMSVMMDNPYPDNGWAGVATSTLGDNRAWQISPGGNYVFDPGIEANGNLAYRISGISVPAPATLLTLAMFFRLPSRRRRLR